MITVRTLRDDEPMPQHLNTGFETMPVMKDFCWVAEAGGKIVGILMGAPCHGALFLVRLSIEEGASRSTAHLLLRHCMRDSKARGLKGYFTFVNPADDVDRRLISICKRAKGIEIPQTQVPVAGRFEEAARY